MTLSQLLTLLHHLGIWLWLTGLTAYLILRYRKKDFLTEGYRIFFRRRFTGFAIFGFILIFATGMALIITGGYAGSVTGKNLLPAVFIWKFTGAFIILLAGLNAWGIDVGIVKRVDELKESKRTITGDELENKIGKLNRLLNIFVLIAIVLTL